VKNCLFSSKKGQKNGSFSKLPKECKKQKKKEFSRFLQSLKAKKYT